MLHLHAALAERERKMISEHTIAALAAAASEADSSPQAADTRAGPARRDSVTILSLGTWTSISSVETEPARSSFTVSFSGSNSIWRAMVASSSSRRIASRSDEPSENALVCEQDLEALARHRRGASRLQKSKQAHAALRPNTRVKRVFFASGIAIGTLSPARRRAASR